MENNKISNKKKNTVRQSVEQEFAASWSYAKKIGQRLINLADDTDVEGTIQGIRSGIVMSGSNLWILICSSIIACIGLDTNSPAVIIGAMLISPLMSPILGIGLSAGINDKTHLVSSIRNFGVAVGLSLFVSFLYFQFTPFGYFTAEMKARTSPTILDAFVALFGGLAGIIAGSRTDKTNAIPGVAIATALMPPLCTSGYGLATGRFDIFGGAFYLFFINAVLICLSTYFIVRLLHFPYIQQIDERVSQKAKRIVYICVFLLLIPSIVFLFNTLKEAYHTNAINNFIAENIHEEVEQGVEWKLLNQDSIHLVKVYYFGQYIKPDSVDQLQEKYLAKLNDALLFRFFSPERVILELTPTDAPPDEDKKRMNEEIALIKSKLVILQQTQEQDMSEKDTEINEHITSIQLKERAIDSLQAHIKYISGDTINFQDIKLELKAIYPNLKELSIGKIQQTKYDTTAKNQPYMSVIKWDKAFNHSTIKYREDRIKDYLKVKLHSDNLDIVTRR